MLYLLNIKTGRILRFNNVEEQTYFLKEDSGTNIYIKMENYPTEEAYYKYLTNYTYTNTDMVEIC